MHKMNIQALGLALFCILLAVVGQTLMKLAIVRSGGMPVLEIGLGGLVSKCLQVPYILVGFGAYGVSAVLWLEVLSELDFSVAFPLVSVSYVLALFIGRYLFDESINFSRILGVLLICSGVFFIIKSQ